MRKTRELALVLIAATVLTVALTWPLAPRLGRVGRVDNGDGQFSIWNVAWVARTLVVDPVHIFDANIFYPHTNTLAYSENNLGAGALAIPVYWATKNPFAAHNFVVLLAFILTATGTYSLVRVLTGDWRGAVVAGICFGFSPFMFAHSAHIQLLMTAGLPFSMLMFHRFVDRISPGRGAALGAVMAAQAFCCGYYGIFAILMVGWASIIVATTRGLWGSARYWLSLATGAAVSILLVLPAFLPYVHLQSNEGFRRELDEAQRYSSNWSDYVASAAYAHGWMLAHLPPWVEVTFPGFLATALGLAGAWQARKRGRGELLVIYGGLALLAAWASFGPRFFLYSALYKTIPLFGWLRAPGRFGLIVDLSFAVLTGVAVSAFAGRARRPALVTAVVALLAVGELVTPTRLREVQPFEPVYRTLATLPRAPIIELPFFYPEVGLYRHSEYMLASTTHWMPMVNGYSDYIPPDFLANVMTMAPFPTPPSMKLIEPGKVRYAVFHMYGYNESNRHDTEVRLKSLEQYFRLLYDDGATRLYEIVGFPP